MNQDTTPPQSSVWVSAIRVIAGCVVGIVIALILLIAVELFSAVVHPLPADFDGSQEELCQHVERYPQWVLAVVVPLWGFIAYVGTWAAARIGNRPAAFIICFLLVTAVLFNVSMLPYPMWFKILSVLAIAIAVVMGGRIKNLHRGAGET
mgnify:CR=1 FL=1